jgi:hypothetical protein
VVHPAAQAGNDDLEIAGHAVPALDEKDHVHLPSSPSNRRCVPPDSRPPTGFPLTSPVHFATPRA